MNDIYHRIIRRCKCSKCKHSTVLASKSQLDSRDLTSFFVFSTRSGTCLANEYDLVAQGWHQTGHIVHRSSPVWVDRWEFWHTWKVAIPIPIVTCILPIPIPILGIFVFPFPCTSLVHSRISPFLHPLHSHLLRGRSRVTYYIAHWG